ncbi:MAG: VanZ family protein [Dysgonamonadaceae bacterium]|jgi:VanZ family protein|nr:VanZ family protein [Dysgonamonadaceae bacterium]MDD3310188.1 VanZ family protein [Dysgonamonadaceae bacterium]MDD3900783.1 VanZ family protein [Dysgonamonadaceae bacterium]MDD4399470.1 VanZ family protein [Dysgonamonadaceae bacterium]MEA5080138.1 VanZ family protein [Dysgonamonadaceae bacterium]
MGRAIRHILLPAFIGLLIFIGTCLLNPSDIPSLPVVLPWDKIVHFGMFFVLSIVCFYDYYTLNNGIIIKGRWIFWGFVVPVIYGGIIELLQKYAFLTRSAEWGDFICDILGSLTATIFALIAYKMVRKKKKNLSL